LGFFRKNNTVLYSIHHLEKADFLIKSADIYAVGTYVPLLDKFPEVKAVADSNLLTFWDYLIAIAGVGSAFAEIADTVPEKDQPGLCYAIQKKLESWKSGSYNAMVDFLNYVTKLMNSGVEMPDAIGGWIWFNLEKHEQSNQQLKELASSLKLVRVVGLPILMTFHNWWKEK